MEGIDLEKKVKEHDQTITDNILPRLNELENVTSEVQKKFNALTNDVLRVQTGQVELAKGQKELENTVVKEGQVNREVIADTKEVIKDTKTIANKLLDHVLKKDEKETVDVAESKKRNEENQAKLKAQKWEVIGKVAVIAAGSGGVFYALIQALQ